jgi:hypothetical protein
MKRLALYMLPLVLAACAAPKPTNEAGEVVSSDVTCDREVRTGTILPKTHCSTAADREAARQAARQAGEAIRPQGAIRGNGGN